MAFRRLAPLALAAALLACGSDSDEHHEDATAPPSTPPPPIPGVQENKPPERREFPLATPSLGGFTLVDAFPGVSANIPSALVWPRVPGATPFVLERTGKVLQIVNGAAREVLDFGSEVALFSEGGALGMALHPAFGDGSGPSPYAFFWYNATRTPRNEQRLVRFTWSTATQSFDRASETIFLEQEEERPEHNGGRIAFGPDGFLYFGNGDDTNSANHQRLNRALFAGIFRIDVDARGGSVSHPPPRQPQRGASAHYFIPNDNPFVGVPGAMEEFYALGLRNPFGFAFDRANGSLWVGDVGETWREEINRVFPGGNYGWPNREGEVGDGPATTIGKAYAPVYSYTHAEMGDLTAVLGGFVYRGKQFPELVGKYIHSDWPSGRVWALDVEGGAAKRVTIVDQWKRIPMALAEDNDGEIYVLHTEGITKLARDETRAAVPKRLTETMLFADVPSLAPEPTLVPYEINSPLWSDAAEKRRWIRLPPGQRVEVTEDGTLKLPTGTLLVKHFELPSSVAPRERTRRLETRVLVVGTETTYGLTYRWNAAGTDADLLADGADETIEDEAAHRPRTWHFPSFGQCWECHRAENRVLGFTSRQLALTRADRKEQRAALAERGVFAAEAIAKMPPGLARPSDTSANLEARATAYLAANCASCHHEGASYLGGEQTWIASPGVALSARGLVGAPHHNYPMARELGLGDAPLIAPGEPARSLLLARIKSANADLRMPPLGRNIVDEEGVRLIEQWIGSMPK